jgi:glycosyl transferase family 87
MLAAAAAVVYLWRTVPAVWSFLFRSPGDFGYNFAAAQALLHGESPFGQGFTYPPLVPLLFVPLVPLGLDGARVAWYLIGQASTVGAAAALVPSLGEDASPGAALVAISWLWALGGAIPENLALGQMNPPLLLLIALAMRWATARPGQRASGAAALGAATALKVWPGLLLLPWLRRGRRRALAVGLAIAGLSVLLPWLLYRATVPPPHLPTGTHYWMGTPALLNFSLPAAALRGTYRWSGHGPMPADWESGTLPAALRLAPYRRRLSVAVSLATLAAGLAALGMRLSWTAAQGRRGARDELAVLAYLAGLCVVASPVAWYHYQLFLLPGAALVAAACLGRRAYGRLALATALALAAAWANRGVEAAQRLGIEIPRYLFAAGLAVPLLDMALLALVLAEIGRSDAAREATSRA